MSLSSFFNEGTITIGVMDDSVGRESSDHKWDSYQKHCIKVVTKLSGCCIDENGKKFIMDIRVPAGCTATVHVPAVNASKVRESNKKPKHLPEVIFEREQDGYAIFKVGSGTYQFVSRL